jgi:hypothetical protein
MSNGHLLTSTGRDQHDRLAARLGPHALSDIETGKILVLPSLSFPEEELRKIVGIQHYEERLLFMTLLLGRPGLEMVYVTSTAIDRAVIDYYLGFLPDASSARDRLHLVALQDARPVPLSAKLIENPVKIEEVRALVDGDTYALAFNVTELEWRLMEILGVLLYGPHPGLIPLGSKTGSRLIAQEAGVSVCPGGEDLTSLEEIERALRGLDGHGSAVIKLNNGFSGQGNAIVSLADLRLPLTDADTIFCAEEESWASFERKIADEGAVVERLLREPGTVSPSVQMRIGADGTYEVVSTHDQILGGPDDQVYLGCRFPADDAYRHDIQRAGRALAAVLAEKGVVGSFGVDFVVVPGPENRVFLSEINLRMGGTSHPFYMARFVTGGHYDEATGHLAVDGHPKFYVASDNLKSETLKGVTPADAIRALQRAGISYDHTGKTGVTLHLLGALEHYGKLGCVAIGDTREQADALYNEVGPVLDELGR